jgi:hypothetical protein
MQPKNSQRPTTRTHREPVKFCLSVTLLFTLTPLIWSNTWFRQFAQQVSSCLTKLTARSQKRKFTPSPFPKKKNACCQQHLIQNNHVTVSLHFRAFVTRLLEKSLISVVIGWYRKALHKQIYLYFNHACKRKSLSAAPTNVTHGLPLRGAHVHWQNTWLSQVEGVPGNAVAVYRYLKSLQSSPLHTTWSAQCIREPVRHKTKWLHSSTALTNWYL